MARLRDRLRALPLDLLCFGLLGAMLLAMTLRFMDKWGPADAYLVAIGTLSLAVALATAALVRAILGLFAKQVDALLRVLGGGRGDAKRWAQGKRVR